MKIQIIGLGLIGGSFCKAIRRSTQHIVLGMDTDLSVQARALESGAIHAIGTIETLAQADLALICLHPEATLHFLTAHVKDFRKGGLVCDSCGIKVAVTEEADRVLIPNGVRFVGCHPMAGREFSGFDYAQESLFDGASFILTPTEKTDHAAVKELEEFARSIGFGRTVIASPAEHDRIIAATSQLAHVVSNAYIKSPTLRKQAGFSAGSYLDLTRVAKLHEEMWTSLFLHNREPLLFEIDTLIANLKQYRDAIDAGDADTLRDILREGRELKEADLKINR
ncbi:MAG: prephenate dehydrogenase [Candidatus Merdivicinus sp.]